jgi:hypothetical protein
MEEKLESSDNAYAIEVHKREDGKVEIVMTPRTLKSVCTDGPTEQDGTPLAFLFNRLRRAL